MPETFDKQVAPDGQIWVCGACGKTNKTRWSFSGGSHGWDESCMLNAVLVYDDKPDGVSPFQHQWRPVQ